MIANESIATDINSSYLLLPEDKFDDVESDDEDLELNTDKVKIQDRKLFVHTYDHSVKSLKEQIDDGALLLADDFQRRRVWDDTKASRLIESLLINVPIPVCYLAELEEGVSSVIDGQQRLTAIYRYLTDDLKLRSLKIRSDLNKSKFSQLGVTDRRNFNVRFIRCVLILKETEINESLARSCILLLCSHLESFFEDSIVDILTFHEYNNTPMNHLPGRSRIKLVPRDLRAI